MSETITLHRPARALAALGHAFEYGRSAEHPGITDAAHTATWHMAGLIEELHAFRAEAAERLRTEALSAGPVRPDEETR